MEQDEMMERRKKETSRRKMAEWQKVRDPG